MGLPFTKMLPPKEVSSSSNENNMSTSSADICRICFEKFTDKSFIISCLHNFCFHCILTWSEQKSTCPFCIQPLTSIVHNVKSEVEFEEYFVIPELNIRSNILENVRLLPQIPACEFYTARPCPLTNRHQRDVPTATAEVIGLSSDDIDTIVISDETTSENAENNDDVPGTSESISNNLRRTEDSEAEISPIILPNVERRKQPSKLKKPTCSTGSDVNVGASTSFSGRGNRKSSANSSQRKERKMKKRKYKPRKRSITKRLKYNFSESDDEPLIKYKKNNTSNGQEG